jgi:hypothetical protein
MVMKTNISLNLTMPQYLTFTIFLPMACPGGNELFPLSSDADFPRNNTSSNTLSCEEYPLLGC